MSIDLNIIYKDIKELEKLIDKFAYFKKYDNNRVNIHIEELRNWLLRVEHIKYSIEEELGIDNDNPTCPLCNGEDNL